MKKNVLLVLMCMFAISSYARKENESVTFNVKLDCENCIKKVESNIAFEKGVKDLACNLEEQSVTVTYAADKTNVEDLKKGFAKIGYDDVTVKKACCSSEKAKTCCSKDADKKACSKEGDKACCSKDADKKACNKDGDKACCSKETSKECCTKDGEKSACCSKEKEHQHAEGEKHVD